MRGESAVTCLLFCIALISAAPTRLPYYTGPSLDVDSGYISVGDIRLFYLHVASEKNPSQDPLVFWFQGGPGGSSMIGAFLEMGPFNIVSPISVGYKSINWLKPGANMVFIDQPACVGYSYSNNIKDCNTSDTNAASVNIKAIKSFMFDVMPQYRNRKFWLTGESYAGSYVPMLSALVVDDQELNPNFAGFMVGNPVMECSDPRDPNPFGVGNTWLFFNQLYWNGYVSQNDYEDWRARGCDSEQHRQGVPIAACDVILNKVQTPKNLGADFNPDNSFSDFCTGNASLSFATSRCTNTPTTIWSNLDSYFAQPEVGMAMHADIPYNSLMNRFNFTQDARNMLKYYSHVLKVKPDTKILVYSGLSDLYTVPFTYTMPCVYQLMVAEKAQITTPWTLWHTDPQHHVGHYQQWSNGFTYATVRGAGHEVPTYQPYSAMIMFDRFIHKYTIAD